MNGAFLSLEAGERLPVRSVHSLECVLVTCHKVDNKAWNFRNVFLVKLKLQVSNRKDMHALACKYNTQTDTFFKQTALELCTIIQAGEKKH